ncbi:hypothetical protein SLV14_004208 [Streptomyces sp. Je 1-4]|nr:hypothetical protein SLV14_004208 [Streptomyces sp. Je 1-4]UZQ37703.1 hypothetical protein SLV14N_004208 [Streptomyces sp. Je 1-4] [Streptomyces sp. Je 1-4 4N24]UZQ45120.1 hypothetical protein SLV14NA_004208 [Streptomyces sp. Je 1-4] [Streptomyces sp. Je 1-4 4N24_ara]
MPEHPAPPRGHGGARGTAGNDITSGLTASAPAARGGTRIDAPARGGCVLPAQRGSHRAPRPGSAGRPAPLRIPAEDVEPYPRAGGVAKIRSRW